MDLRPGVEIRDVFPDSYSIRELDTRLSTTLKYKEEYCYEYDNMLIAGMTPQEFINNEVSGQQKRATAEAAEEEAETQQEAAVTATRPRKRQQVGQHIKEVH